jgi:LPS-assembly lipoprotein
MWWRKAGARAVAARGLLCLGLAAALLGGCGFRPLYAPPEPGAGDPALARVQVVQIPERLGQIMTIALRDGFNPAGPPVDPRYALYVTLATERIETAIRRDGTASRAGLNVYADYTLVDLEKGSVAMNGLARSLGAVDLVENEYANIVAEQDSRVRSVQELATEIQTRVALFLRRDATAAR